MSASGTLAIPETHSGGGVLFGWFNHQFTPGMRPTNSIMFHINGEKRGGHIHVRVISANSHGTGAQILKPGAGKHDLLYEPGATKHRWSIQYDPAGPGRVTVVFDDLTPIVFDLSEDVRKDGATLDRFGIVNAQKAGGFMRVFLDDLVIGDQKMDFASDPKWESIGSHASFEDHDLVSDHNFGYSETNFAGGEKGEIGGTIWRSERLPAWYADSVGPLDLSKPLHASGKITLKIGAPDSGVLLGWFNSNGKDAESKEPNNFLGAHIEGPTRVGHYFAPLFCATDGTRRRMETAAVLLPDAKSHQFSIDYDPEKSELRTTLDGQSTTLAIRPQDKKSGAAFDRFGLRSVRVGGQQVKVYLDDLSYTTAK